MRVTRVELETQSGEEWKITLSEEWRRSDPKVNTIPDHVRDALLRWLEARS